MDRVELIRVGDGARRCVVDGHRVLGILAGITAQQVVVLGDVTGQMRNLYLVLAASVEREGVQVLLRCLDGAELALVFGEGVPLRRVARHGVPIVRIIDTCARAFIALEHHSEQYAGARANGLVGLRQVIIRLVHGRRRGDGLLRAGERTALPNGAVRVHTAAVDDNAARAVLVARGHVLELHATVRCREARAVTFGHLCFLQEVVPAIMVFTIKVIEVDNAVVHFIPERQLSIRVRGAGAKKAFLISGRVSEALVCLVQRELSALHQTAILVELDNVGLGDRHEVVLELHVGVGGATLQVEELERVAGVASEGAASEARSAPPRCLELS